MTDRELAYLNGLRDGYLRALEDYGPKGRSKEQQAKDTKYWAECARRKFPSLEKQSEAA